MIYLDYSATTPVNDEVLDTYVKSTKKFIGNPNSLHSLGFEAKKIIDDATTQVKNIFNTDKEVIYTSGATEANNLAIFGIVNKYSRGKKIITTHLEHSSIVEPLKKLEKDGFDIYYVKLNSDGSVDLEDLEKELTDDTILVTIATVNSELGIIQDLDKISSVVRKNPKVIFHTDATQVIGKKKISFDSVDLVSMSSQKFYGMKGVGVLLKNKNILLEPIIYGGKSTTNYRSGTPATPLIVSFSKALRLAYIDIDKKYMYVEKLSNHLKSELNKIPEIIINSTDISIPHIVNFSVNNIKSETLLHALEEEEIFISTKTACNKDNDYSEAVYEITKDKIRSSHSLRVSISYLTTEEEINTFVEVLKNKISLLSTLNYK